MLIFPFISGLQNGDSFADCLMIFLGQEAPDVGSIDDVFARWALINVPPPKTIIVGKLPEIQKFHAEAIETTGKYKGLERLYRHGGHESLLLCGFDYTGVVRHINCNSDGLTVDVTETFHRAVRTFVEQQVNDNDVVIPAPVGTFFDKLSSRFSTHFIRAEALLHSTECIELLALRLLKPFNEWHSKIPESRGGSIITYLDTMGMWPVAEKLGQFHRISNGKEIDYKIESFKSYDGLATWDPPRRQSFVIISASTSGGLASEVSKKLGQPNAEVWTILALAQRAVDQGYPKNIIAEIPRTLKGRPALDGLRGLFEPNILSLPPGAETISIVGERFLNQAAKPKRVRLIHKVLDETTKANLVKIAKADVIKVARGRFDGVTRWTLSFDYEKLLGLVCDSDEGKNQPLLESWLKNYSSPTPTAIVYPSVSGAFAKETGEAAIVLADKAMSVLKKLNPNSTVFTVSSDELVNEAVEAPAKLSDCSIVVVVPIVGNGFALKQISALLRHKQPTGPRLFISLAVLAETQAHLTQLKGDIASVSADDRRYDFKSYFSLPIGRLDQAFSWSAELAVLHDVVKLMDERKIEGKSLRTRVQRIEALEVLDDNAVFLPSSSESPLYLSSGFFLWPGSEEISGDNYGGAVLLSIAALLQGARIATSRADDTSLRTGLFQHALICPETFTRFNDAVIQAAILRAAYPAELNYSVSAEISHDMERLIIKWFQYHEHPVGAASAEFLLAIANGKLKLQKEHVASVLNFGMTIPGWVGCLAEVAKRRLAI